ncbi:MAG: ABC transporter ATP-binding protein [Bacteroidota bacterium]|jgi:ATP-binding cassette subfamily B protein/subfamily B ATP-binding cassette protein MsbA|nr:ATP-binding cassette, subfamily bacterial MsbA [Bacteroidota bacterium]
MKDVFKILRRFLPPYKKYAILIFVFNGLTAIFSLFSFATIIPILQILFGIGHESYSFIPWNSPDLSFTKIVQNNGYWFISQLIANYGAETTLLVLAVWLMVITVFKTGTEYLGSYFIVPIRTGIVRDIRNNINDKILSLHLGFFSDERKGDILARISGDVDEVERSILSSLVLIFKNPILILVYLTMMMIISWKLTLFVFILLPASTYIMGSIGRRLKQKSFELQNKWGELMSQVEETLGGLRVIKSFNAEGKIVKRFHAGTQSLRKLTNRILRRQELAVPVSEFLGTLTIAIVLWFGGTLILNGEGVIDAPTFMFYIAIFFNIIAPAKAFSNSTYIIQRGLASMERIDKILKAESVILEKENPLKLTFEKQIEYRNVWFKYKDEWILKGINLTIEKGTTIALVGESGSGKSTLTDLLVRFYDVQEGEIMIDDTNIKDVSLHDLRALTSMVTQDPILFNDTFFNNIAFGVEHATQEEVERAAKIANAHEFIMATPKGYDTIIGERGGKLSGGQRQRICIARAVLKNPEIFIFDEATSALDSVSEKLVQEALENISKNRTTLTIAHRLSTIRNADEICVMHQGEIVERGRHNDLYARNGYYKKLCDAQINLSNEN